MNSSNTYRRVLVTLFVCGFAACGAEDIDSESYGEESSALSSQRMLKETVQAYASVSKIYMAESGVDCCRVAYAEAWDKTTLPQQCQAPDTLGLITVKRKRCSTANWEDSVSCVAKVTFQATCTAPQPLTHGFDNHLPYTAPVRD